MIRSSACQPWQPDLPGHAGDRGDLLSYTTPWDTIVLGEIARSATAAPPLLSGCLRPPEDGLQVISSEALFARGSSKSSAPKPSPSGMPPRKHTARIGSSNYSARLSTLLRV